MSRSGVGRTYLLALAAALAPAPVATAQALDSTTYPPRGAYTHGVQISAPFDPEQGKTVLQTGRIQLTPSLAISALTALDGRTVTAPATSVVLTFWSTASPPIYATNRGVVLTLNDSITVELGNAWVTPTPASGFAEVLLKSLSVGRFLALANARTARLQVGPTVVALSPDLLQGFRDFASRMAP